MNGSSVVNDLEWAKVLVLSTAHLGESIATPDDDEPAPMDHLANMSGQDGWLVYTGYDSAYYKAKLARGAPSAVDVFVDLMHWARKHGARYVLFDSDGPTVSGFPTYNW